MSARQVADDDRLFRTLAEQLKLSLLQIARQSEILDATPVNKDIMNTADMALQLIDGYLLSTDVHAQQSLVLQPISISSVLYESAQELRNHARMYDCDVEVSLSGKYAPIIGNMAALKSAFTALGSSLIEAQSADGPRRIVLATHRSARGIVAGVFGEQQGLSADMFRRARALYGTSRQPLVNTSSSAAAGVFVADSLFTSIASPLRVAHHHKLSGLATTLLPSQQLQLV